MTPFEIVVISTLVGLVVNVCFQMSRSRASSTPIADALIAKDVGRGYLVFSNLTLNSDTGIVEGTLVVPSEIDRPEHLVVSTGSSKRDSITILSLLKLGEYEDESDRSLIHGPLPGNPHRDREIDRGIDWPGGRLMKGDEYRITFTSLGVQIAKQEGTLRQLPYTFQAYIEFEFDWEVDQSMLVGFDVPYPSEEGRSGNGSFLRVVKPSSTDTP